MRDAVCSRSPFSLVLIVRERLSIEYDNRSRLIGIAEFAAFPPIFKQLREALDFRRGLFRLGLRSGEKFFYILLQFVNEKECARAQLATVLSVGSVYKRMLSIVLCLLVIFESLSFLLGFTGTATCETRSAGTIRTIAHTF